MSELETAVSGVGDYIVTCALQAKDGPAQQPIHRLVELNGHRYRANVYGRRLYQTTQHGIPLSGVVLGETMVLEDTALADSSSDSFLSESPYTEGRKSVLVIRVDFSDLPGDPGWGLYTREQVQNLLATLIGPYFQQSSYGISTLTNTVSSELYRMPQSAASYATNLGSWQLLLDAQAAATANYNVDSYDRLIVLFSWLGNFPGSLITYGGMAEIGGPHIWVNGEIDFRVVAHELGHTYGLFHGNLWQVSDGNAISTNGVSTEHGDDFDTMGANFANDVRTDFNPWFKSQLNWIRTNQVQVVTTNGTYRINRFDNGVGTGISALKIAKNADRNYWIGCRRSFISNPSMQNGAYIIWGYNRNQQSDLLDATTPGYNDQDAALAIGSILKDSEAQVALRPVTQGGLTPNEYIDVEVAFGVSPQMPPMVTSQPLSQAVWTGQSATFEVAASALPIPNGPPIPIAVSTNNGNVWLTINIAPDGLRNTWESQHGKLWCAIGDGTHFSTNYFTNSLSMRINVYPPFARFIRFAGITNWQSPATVSISLGANDATINALYQTNGPPQIVNNPVGTVGVPGTQVILAAGANGAGPLFYQWVRNGQPVPTGTTNSLFLLLNSSNAGLYSLRVSNAFGSVTSATAPVVIGPLLQWQASNLLVVGLAGHTAVIQTASQITSTGFNWTTFRSDVITNNEQPLNITGWLSQTQQSGFLRVRLLP